VRRLRQRYGLARYPMSSASTTIERSLESLARLQPPRHRRAEILALALGAFVALVGGVAIADGRVKYAAPFAGVALIVLCLRSEQLAFLGIVVLASTFADAYALPKAGPLYPAEAMMFVGLATLPFLRSTAVGGLMGVAVALFLGAVVLGIFVAGGHGVSVHEAELEARVPALYASFWVALAAVRGDPRRFFALLTGAAGLVAVLSILQFAVHGHKFFIAGQLPVITPDNGFLRIRAPGLLLPYFGAIIGLSYVFWGPPVHRRRALLFVALFGTTILISLNRNMIVGLTVGLLTALLLLPRRTQAGVRIVLVAAAVTVIVTVSGHGTIVQRILSLGNRTYLQQTTLNDRAYENAFARATIARHPVSGIGFGVPYGALQRTTSGTVVPRSGTHNQYYEVWMKMGLLGVAALVTLLAAAVLRSAQWARKGPAEHRWIGAGALACVVAFAASSVVGAYVVDSGSAPVAAGLFALIAAGPAVWRTHR
jgi:O-antigen ligase